MTSDNFYIFFPDYLCYRFPILQIYLFTVKILKGATYDVLIYSGFLAAQDARYSFSKDRLTKEKTAKVKIVIKCWSINEQQRGKCPEKLEFIGFKGNDEEYHIFLFSGN